MAIEVCPFCGKSYKRLKSHLPHCKAAKPPLSHRWPAGSPPSGQLVADSSKTKERNTAPLSKMSPEVPGKSGNTSPQPASKPKKGIRASIEAAKSGQIPAGLNTVPENLATSTRSKSKATLYTESPKAPNSQKKKQIQPAEKEVVDIKGETPRITLQHVGSTLNRAKTSRPTIQIETAQKKTQTGPDLNPPSTSVILQPKESPFVFQDDSRAYKATSHNPLPVSKLQTSKGGLPWTEPASVSPGRLLDRRSRGGDALASVEMRKDDSTGRALGQVTLRELPEWLARRTPRRPGEAVEMMQRGWQWYYKKYMDVRKGGVGGFGMLLAGYCVLSYVWAYPRLKHDRWRKYH
ncbi:uncharacterized protein C17orf80 homolog [Syngnathoides biaculeatus]|uniref:uncharacterized protein C17orf80 homolog n=1 Tax=Syngnathoides biaculeatus TaxID=300417 RepID=UPI002ADD833F|nr:uncharacterized protein C17orf80 homolog [Syngnathoides biaculeatus]XP_061665989.1 uncharacterized protein C17orf80 homolog [Syngnathoides biaculeatus]XP_061665990.1 uncharacterized protein C17orf80 homolog [Syngnathoides biaculeatus]XP_061665991.1 uncharacterized protein C17orf80 homolog [Syngnathoides biaculeatus]